MAVDEKRTDPSMGWIAVTIKKACEAADKGYRERKLNFSEMAIMQRVEDVTNDPHGFIDYYGGSVGKSYKDRATTSILQIVWCTGFGNSKTVRICGDRVNTSRGSVASILPGTRPQRQKLIDNGMHPVLLEESLWQFYASRPASLNSPQDWQMMVDVIARENNQVYSHIIPLVDHYFPRTPNRPEEAAVSFGQAATQTPSYAQLGTYSQGTSNKFWRVEVFGICAYYTYGKIGGGSQTQVKSFSSPQGAIVDASNKWKEKIRKGYTRVDPASWGRYPDSRATRLSMSSGVGSPPAVLSGLTAAPSANVEGVRMLDLN